jgi:hypothetical protein
MAAEPSRTAPPGPKSRSVTSAPAVAAAITASARGPKNHDRRGDQREQGGHHRPHDAHRAVRRLEVRRGGELEADLLEVPVRRRSLMPPSPSAAAARALLSANICASGMLEGQT